MATSVGNFAPLELGSLIAVLKPLNLQTRAARVITAIAECSNPLQLTNKMLASQDAVIQQYGLLAATHLRSLESVLSMASADSLSVRYSAANYAIKLASSAEECQAVAAAFLQPGGPYATQRHFIKKLAKSNNVTLARHILDRLQPASLRCSPQALALLHMLPAERILREVDGDPQLPFKLNWSRLCRSQPELGMQLMRQLLNEAAADDAVLESRWALVSPGIKVLLEHHRPRCAAKVLDLVEQHCPQGHPLPDFFTIRKPDVHGMPHYSRPMAKRASTGCLASLLVPSDRAAGTQALARLTSLMTGPAARKDSANILPALELLSNRQIRRFLTEDVVGQLAEAAADSLGSLHNLLTAIRDPALRAYAYRRAAACPAGSATLAVPPKPYDGYDFEPLEVLRALPGKLRDSEAERLLRVLPWLGEVPRVAAELTALRHWPVVKEELQRACSSGNEKLSPGNEKLRDRALHRLLECAVLAQDANSMVEALEWVANRMHNGHMHNEEESKISDVFYMLNFNMPAKSLSSACVPPLQKIMEDELASPDSDAELSMSPFAQLACRILVLKARVGTVEPGDALVKWCLKFITRVEQLEEIEPPSFGDGCARTAFKQLCDDPAAARLLPVLLPWMLGPSHEGGLPAGARNAFVLMLASGLGRRGWGCAPLQDAVKEALFDPRNSFDDEYKPEMWLGPPAMRDRRAEYLALAGYEELEKRVAATAPPEEVRAGYNHMGPAVWQLLESGGRASAKQAAPVWRYIAAHRADIVDRVLADPERYQPGGRVPLMGRGPRLWLADEQSRYAECLKKPKPEPEASTSLGRGCWLRRDRDDGYGVNLTAESGDEAEEETQAAEDTAASKATALQEAAVEGETPASKAKRMRQLCQLWVTRAQDIEALTSAGMKDPTIMHAGLFGIPRLDNQAGALALLLKWTESDELEPTRPKRGRGPTLGFALARCARYAAQHELIPALRRFDATGRVTLQKQVARVLITTAAMMPQAAAMLLEKLEGWELLHKDVRSAMLVAALPQLCGVSADAGLYLQLLTRCATTADEDTIQKVIMPHMSRMRRPHITSAKRASYVRVLIQLAKAGKQTDEIWRWLRDAEGGELDRDTCLLVARAAAESITGSSNAVEGYQAGAGTAAAHPAKGLEGAVECLVACCRKAGALPLFESAAKTLAARTTDESHSPDAAAPSDVPARQRLRVLCKSVAGLAAGSSAGLAGLPASRTAAGVLEQVLRGTQELAVEEWRAYTSLVLASIDWGAPDFGQLLSRMQRLASEAPGGEQVFLAAELYQQKARYANCFWDASQTNGFVSALNALAVGTAQERRIAVAGLGAVGEGGGWASSPKACSLLAALRQDEDPTVSGAAMDIITC